MSKNILDNTHSDIPNINLLIKKIIIVLSNLLLSKNEDVAISALNLYSVLPRYLFKHNVYCFKHISFYFQLMLALKKTKNCACQMSSL